jgi:hypothetical protein
MKKMGLISLIFAFVFPLIFQKDAGIELKQLKCQKQGQNKQAQCTLNKPIFCPNNGETLTVQDQITNETNQSDGSVK